LEFQKPRRLSRKILNENRWFNHFQDAIELSSGTIWEEYHVIDFPKDSVMALVENDKQELLFVRVYRYPTDMVQWELPAGNFEQGEDALEAARREVREETGYNSVNHELIYSFYPIDGISNKVFHVVRCLATDGIASFDQDEIIEHRWFSRQDALQMIKTKELKDGYTLTALLLDLNTSL